MELTQQQAADAFGVTARTIRRWTDAGMPAHGERTARTYRLGEMVAWRMEQERASLARQAGEDVPPRTESEARLAAARAALAELELGREREELIPLDVHAEALGVICDRLRAALLNVPGRYAPLFVGLRSTPDAMRRLDDVVFETLTALSTDIPAELETEAEAQAAEEEDA